MNSKKLGSSQIAKVAGTAQMLGKEEVHRFWVESTKDCLSNLPTGIDISQRQDGYWKSLDNWEKEIALNNLADGTLLDLGCGTGRITKHLRSFDKNVISIDYVRECLSVLRNSCSAARCVQMDSTLLGFKDASFDCVVSCRVLQSLPTLQQKELAVKEIARILKSGGKLILTEGNPARQRFVRVPYNFYISLSEWKRLLERYGLCVERIYGIPFLTAAKVLDKLSFSTLGRTTLPFKFASSLDRRLGLSFLKHLSLQFDIIAEKT